jgi:hypothetical protein
LVDTAKRLLDPVIDQPGPGNTRCPRARRATVHIRVQERSQRPKAKQFCDKPKVGGEQRCCQRINDQTLAGAASIADLK